jgi:hypothetical protein
LGEVRDPLHAIAGRSSSFNLKDLALAPVGDLIIGE